MMMKKMLRRMVWKQLKHDQNNNNDDDDDNDDGYYSSSSSSGDDEDDSWDTSSRSSTDDDDDGGGDDSYCSSSADQEEEDNNDDDETPPKVSASAVVEMVGNAHHQQQQQQQQHLRRRGGGGASSNRQQQQQHQGILPIDEEKKEEEEEESVNSKTNKKSKMQRRQQQQQQQQQKLTTKPKRTRRKQRSILGSSCSCIITTFFRRRRHQRYHPATTTATRAEDVCSAISTILFCTSLLVWLVISMCGIFRIGVPSSSSSSGGSSSKTNSMLMKMMNPNSKMSTTIISMDRLTVRQRTKLRTRDTRHIRGHRSDLMIDYSIEHSSNNKNNKNKESLGQGQQEEQCVRPEWQNYRFLNCNEIHGVDLAADDDVWDNSGDNIISKQKQQQRQPSPNIVGYLNDGLWRTVWAVPGGGGGAGASGGTVGATGTTTSSANDNDDIVVMKMMKQEHDITERNIDRHRRDALVMERLTKSPYVVNVYGYCGNTVLTEYIATTLQDVIRTKNKNNQNPYSHNRRRGRRRRNDHNNNNNMSPPSLDKEVLNVNATRETPYDRLELALDVAKGLKALHTTMIVDNNNNNNNNSPSPIVHADLQSKQFLVTADGRVKINDFNRCRFMMQSNDTLKEPCSFRIPTAPGKWRSPEEYAYQELTEKMDIFALANILHEILTGEDPWLDWSAAEVRKTVRKGMRPLATDGISTITEDAALQNLTLRAYELDPETRISASELVRELEMLVSQKRSI